MSRSLSSSTPPPPIDLRRRRQQHTAPLALACLFLWIRAFGPLVAADGVHANAAAKLIEIASSGSVSNAQVCALRARELCFSVHTPSVFVLRTACWSDIKVMLNVLICKSTDPPWRCVEKSAVELFDVNINAERARAIPYHSTRVLLFFSRYTKV